MLKFLQTQEPVHWEVARQVARWMALEGSEEAPLGATERAGLVEIAAAAEAHVLSGTDLPAPAAKLEMLGRGEWAERALVALRPILRRLAVSLQGEGSGSIDVGGPTSPVGPMGPMGPMGPNPMASLFGALGPLLLGVQCGFMVGQLAQGLLSQHDLLLPVADPPQPAFIVPNIEAFHAAWSIPADDLRFYLALQEAVRSRICSRAWVRERLVRLATEYVGSFRVDPAVLEAQFGSFDPSDPSSLEGLMGDPDAMLGAMQSPEQLVVLERFQTTTAVLETYADVVVERVGGPLLTSLPTIREAMRRHWVERSEADRFIQRLLGLDPSRKKHDQAAAFCAGVTERAGPAVLARLLEGEAQLPTRAELEAPGLWLARLETFGDDDQPPA